MRQYFRPSVVKEVMFKKWSGPLLWHCTKKSTLQSYTRRLSSSKVIYLSLLPGNTPSREEIQYQAATLG